DHEVRPQVPAAKLGGRPGKWAECVLDLTRVSGAVRGHESMASLSVSAFDGARRAVCLSRVSSGRRRGSAGTARAGRACLARQGRTATEMRGRWWDGYSRQTSATAAAIAYTTAAAASPWVTPRHRRAGEYCMPITRSQATPVASAA